MTRVDAAVTHAARFGTAPIDLGARRFDSSPLYSGKQQPEVTINDLMDLNNSNTQSQKLQTKPEQKTKRRTKQWNF